MLTPVNATLPDSTLAPAQVLEKFQSTSLAGPHAATTAGWRRRRAYLESAWMARYSYGALQGLGQDDTAPAACGANGTFTDQYGNIIDSETGAVCVLGTDLQSPTAPASAIAAANAQGVAVPASNAGSAAWANFYTALAKGGYNLAEIATIQPGTTVSPTGAITRQTAGYPVATPGTVSALTAGLTSGTMMLLLVGLGAILLLGKRS